jgi:gamma-glutamyl phosphate reductase
MSYSFSTAFDFFIFVSNKLIFEFIFKKIFKEYIFSARKGSRILQALTPEQRSDIILRIANSLQSKKEEILVANSQDITAAENSGNN